MLETKRTLPLLVILALILSTLACNLPGTGGASAPDDVARAVAETLAVEDLTGDGPPPEDAPPPDAGPPDEAPVGPTDTPEPSATPTITPTPTPSVPMVSVSVNTNCRTGPGTAYDLVGGLLVGDTAQIVALSSVNNYVVIELPDGTGRDCWLWMQYGTQTGDTSGLPVLSPPPTPTPPPPAIAFSMAFYDMDPCAGKEVMFYRVVNTGEAIVRSYSISAENLDTSETVSNQGSGIARSAGCIVLAPPLTFEPGETGYLTAGFTPPIAGQTIVATITLCTEAGLGGECTSQSLTYTVGFPSDVNAKENFAAVDTQHILERLLALPITSWRYIDQTREGRHIGPMAQDFYDAFGVGEYETSIQVVDAYGVAFAAIQAMAEQNAAQTAQLAELEAQQAALQARLAELEQQKTVPSALLLTTLVLAGLTAGWLLAQRHRTPGEPLER